MPSIIKISLHLVMSSLLVAIVSLPICHSQNYHPIQVMLFCAHCKDTSLISYHFHDPNLEPSLCWIHSTLQTYWISFGTQYIKDASQKGRSTYACPVSHFRDSEIHFIVAFTHSTEVVDCSVVLLILSLIKY